MKTVIFIPQAVKTSNLKAKTFLTYSLHYLAMFCNCIMLCVSLSSNGRMTMEDELGNI
jgi:hypothetical protein